MLITNNKKRKSIFLILLSILILLVIFFSLTFLITPPYYATCLFKNITGYPCPGCGLTEIFHFFAISHLKFKQAFELNPFGFIFYLIFLLAFSGIIFQLFELRKGKIIFSHSFLEKYALRIILIIFIALFIFGITRIILIMHHCW